MSVVVSTWFVRKEKIRIEARSKEYKVKKFVRFSNNVDRDRKREREKGRDRKMKRGRAFNTF